MADLATSNNDMSPATTAVTPFPFMRLQLELRQQIYDCYFEDIPVMIPTKRRYWFDKILGSEQGESASTSIPRKAFSISVLRPYLNLLRSSSQVRSEAAPVLYKQHISSNDLAIHFTPRPYALIRLMSFCRSVAVYNADASFTLVFDQGTDNSAPFAASAETLFDHLIQQTQIEVSYTPQLPTDGFRRRADNLRIDGVLDNILEISAEIAGFHFGYTPSRMYTSRKI